MRAQALAAQKFKEQKELERRRRLEELRVKDDQRRQQVEERKRAINEAERDRLESILRRNQERDARIEAKKKNERSSIFAFGSSTPRMLDPTDVTVSFWGHRRATSTQNITTASSGSSLTRRQSERDLDVGSKKRATSAGGLERAGESMISPTTPAGCASGYTGRRRTDLVPTIPSRDSSFHSSTSRKSLNHSPGRAYSMSRLDQLAKPRKPVLPALNESNMAPKSSVTRSMSHLAHVGTKLSPRKPLNKADSRSMHQLSPDGHHHPVAPPRVNRATQLRQQKLLMAQSSSASEASSRPSSSMSQQSTNSVTSSVNVKHRLSTTPRRPRPASIAVTGISHERNSFDKGENKPPLPKTRKPLSKTNTSEKIEKTSKTKAAKSPAEETAPKLVADEKKGTKTEKSTEPESQQITQKESDAQVKEPSPPPTDEKEARPVKDEPGVQSQESSVVELPSEKSDNTIQDFINTERKYTEDNVSIQKTEVQEVESQNTTAVSTTVEKQKTETKEAKQESTETVSSEMTTSVSKPRITTAEEAKAALAERRRLIREEAERQAELERQRIEAEERAEYERQMKEEEQARLLAEMQRQAEQERLQEAIREAQRREEEERLRREEEARQKQLKEEADRKAKEEAEKQKAELQKKLENEEREREERRRRVEMIMSRTRGKNNANNLPSQNSKDKSKSENKQDKEENKLNDDNKVNENKLNGSQQENGTSDTTTKNGKDVGIVDNIIPDDSVKNANTTVTDTLNSDSINSNNAWQPSQQFIDVS
ncbi:uncharacterized protein LOC143197770 isoform X6 [Rhynchophorus ferrugineus]